jgi:glycosyltransferase involved in cell wall biosynthesis
MKILHVVPTYLPATRYGGPIHSVHGLCRGLVEAGHAVDVFTTSVDGPTDSDVPHEQPVDLDGVQITYFRSRFGRRLYWSPPMQSALERSITSYDVVHLHAVYLWPTNIAARVAERARVPYVISPRGMLVAELVSRKNAWVKASWLTLIESQTLANAAHVHMTSTRELDDARKLPLPLPSPWIVPNGVRGPDDNWRARVSERAQALIGRGPYVLFLGRVHWKKGLPRTVEALRGTSLQLLVCGPDEEGFARELRAQAKHHGVEAQLRIEGSVAGADKWALLEAARCVVLASDNENFGNVVPEAMWMKTPVVVSDLTGASEVVERAGCGLVCARDPAAVRDALLKLWQDDALRTRLGEAGERYARTELTWRSVADKMMGCYQSALALADDKRL